MKTAAAIVTYHPNPDKLDAVVAAVLPQVDAVILVDNTDDPWAAATTQASVPEQVIYHRSGTNEGVGAAHNHAIGYARRHDMDYLLLLDQDSVPHPRMVESLVAAHCELAAQHVLVSAVGPTYKDDATGAESFFITLHWWGSRRLRAASLPASAIVPADMLISSGALLPMATIREVGEMDEQLFIDHVDTEWFLRAASKGYQAFGVCGARMTHSLGERLIRIWLGRWRMVPVHSPFRMYYTFRNSVLLYRRDYTPLRWVTFDLKRLLLMALLFGLIVRGRSRRVAMMAKGIAHGLGNRTGAL